MKVERTSWIKGVVLVGVGVAIGVAMPGAQPSSAKEVKKVEPVRIGYVNLEVVLGEYEHGREQGKAITELREGYAEKIKVGKVVIDALNEQIRMTEDGHIKAALQARVVTSQKKLDELDVEAKERLTAMSDKAVIKVHDQIHSIVTDIANERGLDVVESFRSPHRPRQKMLPQTAGRILQESASMPFFLKPELDFTDEVIERLNKKHPPEQDEKAGK